MKSFSDYPDRLGAASGIEAAIEGRFSARAFTAQTPSKEVLTEILRLAARAPSGTNTQPWKVYVVQGGARDALAQQVCDIHEAARLKPEVLKDYQEAYDYYPREWVSPYIERRRENGWSLYGLLGITKADKEQMHLQQQRNYRFFDAPVALFITVDKVMGEGSLLDAGMFVQNTMLAARAKGLHTCPQAAWNPFASIVLPHIGAGEHEMLVCAVCIGYADEGEKVNAFHTPREAVESFTTWLS